MSRQVRVLFGIGALFAVLVGAALFLVMSEPGSDQPADKGAGENVAVVPESSDEAVEEKTGGRKRAQRQGGARIFGEVRRDEGETPVANQSVVLAGEGDVLVEAKTDTSGHFSLEGIPDGGPYELVVAAEGFATVRLPGIALDRKEERDVGTLLLDAAVTVDIRVRTLTDVPIADADVLAYAAPEMGPGFDWSKAMAQMGQEPVPVATMKTNAEGVATFADLAAGSWTFLAQKDGFARSGKAGRRLRAREEIEPVTLYMGTGYTLTGKVTDDGGGPVSGALVMAGRDANAWNVAAAPLRARALSAEDGSYTIDGLGAGDMSIMAAPPDAVPAQIDRIRVPDVPNYDIILRKGGLLTGIVKMKESGEPVEGANVRAWAWGSSGGRSAEATTDAEGRYSISDLPEGNVNNVVVSKEGLVQVVEQQNFRGSAFRKGVVVERDVEMTVGASLSGTVSGPKGPVAGANVTIMYEQQQGNFNNKQVKTDANGKYEVTDLTEGRVLINASAEGLHTPDFPNNWWMALQNGSAPEHLTGKVVAGETLTLDVTLATGTSISGRVETPDGEPVEGARVIANVQGSWGNRANNVTTGADGTFTITGIPAPSTVTVTAIKQGMGLMPVDPVQVTADAPTTDVKVVMQSFPTVTGRVTIASGDLPTDTYVKVIAVPKFMRGRPFNPGAFGQNAEVHPVLPDGSFSAQVPIVSGSFVVRAEAPGAPAGNSDSIELEEGKAAYETEVELGEGHALTGRVTDDRTGNGIPGARVRVSAGGNMNSREMEVMALDGAFVSSSPMGGGGGGSVVAITDDEGHFSIRGLPAGDHKVQAQSEGYVAGSADVRTPGTGAVSVQLEAETELAGVVVFSNGKPVEGVNVNARSADPQAAAGGRGGQNAGRSGFSMTDSEGRFEIRKMRRGQYILSVANGWMGSANIQPHQSPPIPAGTTDIRIVVQEGLRIAGKIVDSEGEPVGQIWINANPQDRSKGGNPVNAQAKPDGTFELLGLKADAGAYTLNFQSGGFGGGNRSVAPTMVKDVRPGTEGLNVVMETGLTIEGKIKLPDGLSFQNGWINANQNVEDGENQGSRGRGNGMVEQSGKFKITGLKPGRYRLTMQTWGNGQNKQLVLEGGDDVAAGSAGLVLTASEGATIEGTVVDDGNQPVAAASVHARPDSGGRTMRARTDENGAFQITGLEDGKAYTVSVRAANMVPSQSKGVAAGTTGLRLSVRAGVSSSGTITDASGNAVANGRVTLSPVGREDLGPSSARTNGDGAFTAAGLEDGVTYEVSVMRRVENVWKTIKAGTIKAGETGVSLQATE